jgi:ActR/RegA family two-component response regulator
MGVLIVDDDLGTRRLLVATLRDAGIAATACESGGQAVDAVTASDFELVLLDMLLGDENGLDVLPVLHRIRSGMPIVVLTGFASIKATVVAMKWGAIDCLEKPLIGDDLVDAVRRFIGGAHADTDTWAAHAGARWAKAVVGVVNAPEDPRTLSGWGLAIGAGEGTLRNWCRTARLSPKRSLSLARLLRAVYLSRSRQWLPEQLLDVVDRRTLNRMLAQGGVEVATPPTIDGFLRNQTLIADVTAVSELRKALRRIGEPGLLVEAG